jgi:hypothetical protein
MGHGNNPNMANSSDLVVQDIGKTAQTHPSMTGAERRPLKRIYGNQGENAVHFVQKALAEGCAPPLVPPMGATQFVGGEAVEGDDSGGHERLTTAFSVPTS